jgi:hypothetical protein
MTAAPSGWSKASSPDEPQLLHRVRLPVGRGHRPDRVEPVIRDQPTQGRRDLRAVRSGDVGCSITMTS